MSAAPLSAALPPVAGGVGAEVNAALSALRARLHAVERCLTGAPSEAMQETARRQLGCVIQDAEALRRLLPDAHGVRTAPTGAQRARRALAALAGDSLTASVASVAAALETTLPEARALLMRAQLKGWAQSSRQAYGEGWVLTTEGVRLEGLS